MKSNIDYIKYAIDQAKKAESFGFTRNECNRNLKIALRQFWQNKELKQSSINPAHRKNIPRTKKAKYAEKHNSEKIEVEHVVPMNVIVNMLMDEKQINVEAIKKILKKYFRVFFVTKSEHTKLSNIRLRSKMPSDWDKKDPFARYKKAKIDYK